MPYLPSSPSSSTPFIRASVRRENEHFVKGEAKWSERPCGRVQLNTHHRVFLS